MSKSDIFGAAILVIGFIATVCSFLVPLDAGLNWLVGCLGCASLFVGAGVLVGAYS
jgi:hypothetical protein